MGMRCRSVAGTGVVCVEMFFAGPAFRIVNSQIGKKIALDLDFLSSASHVLLREFPLCKKITADGKRSAKFPPYRSFLAP